MTVETAPFISGLQPTSPHSSDPVYEGDDHIRLIKQALIATFPNIAGEMETNHTRLNLLSDLVVSKGTVETRLHALETDKALKAPTGTKMLFYSVDVPPTWRIDTAINDRLLRVVSGTGAGTPTGTDGTSFTYTHKHEVAGHPLTPDEMPKHSHGFTASITQNRNGDDGSGEQVGSVPQAGTTAEAGLGQAHTHGMDEKTFTWSPSVANVLVGIKD